MAKIADNTFCSLPEDDLLVPFSKASLQDDEDGGKVTATTSIGENDNSTQRSLAETRCPELDDASKIIKDFLLKNSPAFSRLNMLREQGWLSKDGDAVFDDQRQKADHATITDEKGFYRMMEAIAKEMNRETGILESLTSVLDLCMAPGGYAAAVLAISPRAKVYGVTLHPKDGGHEVLLPKDKLANLKWGDITM